MAAYLVFHNRIHDAQKMQEYVPEALETLKPYHPEVLIFDENSKVIEGNAQWPRTSLYRRDAWVAQLASPPP